MKACRLEGKVKFIFVIKEVMDYKTNKAGSTLVCFIGEIQAFGTKAMDTSQMEKSIEISLKDILHQLYKRNIGTKTGIKGAILPEFSRIKAIR